MTQSASERLGALASPYQAMSASSGDMRAQKGDQHATTLHWNAVI
jgi:hypothetical protein